MELPHCIYPDPIVHRMFCGAAEAILYANTIEKEVGEAAMPHMELRRQVRDEIIATVATSTTKFAQK